MPETHKKRKLIDVLREFRRPKVAAMFALGFSSGLPFLLSQGTFGYWLRDEGTALTAIGFLAWVGFAYTFKYLWAPFIDRLPAPLLGRLGRRKGWVLITQVLIGAALIGMAAFGVHGPGGLVAIGILALIVAFASATQDIAVDAWRIESASDSDELGLLTATFQLGYRVALWVTQALVLILAQFAGWSLSYTLMAALMLIGVVAALLTPEPERADAVLALAAPLTSARGIYDAIAGPLIEFFRVHGPAAFLMLLMISLYRLPEFVIGPVAGPFYHDLGLAKATVGAIRGSVGLVASIAGIAMGGVLVLRLGYLRALILGAVIQGLGVSVYAVLAAVGPKLWMFAAAMASDNFCYALAGVALVTYMSSLTSLGYTATQYALLSSTYTIFGKFLEGFSGAAVDALTPGRSLMGAYSIFYSGAGAIALPAIVMCLVLIRMQRKQLIAAKSAPLPRPAEG